MQAQESQRHPKLVLAYFLSDFLKLHMLSKAVLFPKKIANVTYLFFAQILDYCKYGAHNKPDDVPVRFIDHQLRR